MMSLLWLIAVMFMLVAPIAMVGVLIFVHQQNERLRFWLYVSFCGPLAVYFLGLFSRSYDASSGAAGVLLFEFALAFLIFSIVYIYINNFILACISILSILFLSFLCFGGIDFVAIRIHLLVIAALTVGGPLLLMLAVDLLIEKALKPKLKGT